MARARLHLTFDERLSGEPVIHGIGARFGLVTTIQRANLDERSGWVILQVDGEEESVAGAVAWLEERGVRVERLDEGA